LNPKILFVAAEAVPLAKTGGLGNAISDLAAALQNRNIERDRADAGWPILPHCQALKVCAQSVS